MWYTIEDKLIKLEIYVQPGAKITAIVGLHDNVLKIKLKSPPVDGKANTELLKYLARIFKVQRKQVALVRGETSRFKFIHIMGSTVNPADLI